MSIFFDNDLGLRHPYSTVTLDRGNPSHRRLRFLLISVIALTGFFQLKSFLELGFECV